MNKWDIRFLDLAKLISDWSKDPSTKCGAAIIRPDRTIASVGFNGFPRRMSDKEEFLETREQKLSRIIHAEMNALLHLKEPAQRYFLYTYPLPPCDRCIVHMIQAGITYFVAPKLPDHLQDRWGASVEKTKLYLRECGLSLEEVDYQ